MVGICRVTKMNKMTHRVRGPVFFAPSWLMARFIKCNPKPKPIAQVMRTRKEKKLSELLELPNSQITGIKPSNSSAIRQRAQTRMAIILFTEPLTLHKLAKIIRLGRHKMQENRIPAVTLSGAAHSWCPAEKQPKIRPNKAKEAITAPAR